MIFNSYVKLPEGICRMSSSELRRLPLSDVATTEVFLSARPHAYKAPGTPGTPFRHPRFADGLGAVGHQLYHLKKWRENWIILNQKKVPCLALMSLTGLIWTCTPVWRLLMADGRTIWKASPINSSADYASLANCTLVFGEGLGPVHWNLWNLEDHQIGSLVDTCGDSIW